MLKVAAALLFGILSIDAGTKTPFSAVFVLEEEVKLVGSAEAPVFGSTSPLIVEDQLYFTNLYENRVMVFHRRDGYVRSWGRRGRGPGEFQMPYGLVRDHLGRFFVNDKSNMRIQQFSAEGAYLRQFPIQVSVDRMFAIQRGQDTHLLVVGFGPGGNRNCLVREYTSAGETVSNYHCPARPALKYNWEADRDNQGRLWVANTLERVVKVFGADGRELREIELRSPSWRPFQAVGIPASEANPNRLPHIQKALRTQAHTSISSMYRYKNWLVVQLLRKNYSDKGPKHIVDVYDLKGRAVVHGLVAPGYLFGHQENRFHFYRGRVEDSPHGETTLGIYQFQERSLKRGKP